MASSNIAKTYKAILLDVDDTLFHREREYVQGLLGKMIQLTFSGAVISLLTSRNKYMVNSVIYDLRVTSPVIIENGALIYDLALNKPVEYSLLDSELVTIIINWHGKAKSPARLGFSTITDFIVNEAYYKELSVYMGTQGLCRLSKQHDPVESEVVSIWIRDLSKDELAELIRLTKEFDCIRRVETVGERSSLFFLSKGAKKEVGFSKWCKYCKITPEEVVFIGDSDSDIEISRLAGLGCAVANSSENLKSVSKVISGNEYGEGVLDILNKVFFH